MARKGNVIWHAMRRRENPEEGVVAREKHLALRDDGVIVKRHVAERTSNFYEGVKRHDLGWKRAGKPKPEVASVAGARAALEPLGFEFIWPKGPDSRPVARRGE